MQSHHQKVHTHSRWLTFKLYGVTMKNAQQLEGRTKKNWNEMWSANERLELFLLFPSMWCCHLLCLTTYKWRHFRLKSTRFKFQRMHAEKAEKKTKRKYIERRKEWRYSSTFVSQKLHVYYDTKVTTYKSSMEWRLTMKFQLEKKQQHEQEQKLPHKMSESCSNIFVKIYFSHFFDTGFCK